MSELIKTAELYLTVPEHLTRLFRESEYPWQILPKIKPFVLDFIKKGNLGYSEIRDGVLVGDGTRISDFAVIEPPCIIGKNCEIRAGAFIRGNVIIGDGCVVGNSTEIKNSILLDKVEAPHYNYVGDSVLGYRSHMGASAICSNLKSDKKNVVVHGIKNYETGLRKVGAFLGEGVEIGCGSVLNPGTVVGIFSSAYPLTSLRGIYPSRSIIKDTKTVVKKNFDKDIFL